MNQAELQASVMTAWVAAKPLTEDRALSIAKTVLLDAGAIKESNDFEEWFKVNGAKAIARING